MKPEEIIRFTVKRDKVNVVVEGAVNYALFSIPFTINRMGLSKMKSRIINIAKGKLAEGLFKCFIEENNIQGFDFDSTQTPYYQVDKGDFIFKGYEWDIKNNFVFCSNFSNSDIMNFLALIPDRHHKNQWGKRFDANFPDKAPNGKAFLFTFMRSIDFDIYIPEKILKELEYYNDVVYKGRPQSIKPENYENRIQKLKCKIGYKYNYNNLQLIITAYTTKTEFNKFRDIPKNSQFKTSQGDICFITRIKNKGVEIKSLPSFKSLISGG